jgi:hypothetical protein
LTSPIKTTSPKFIAGRGRPKVPIAIALARTDLIFRIRRSNP